MSSEPKKIIAGSSYSWSCEWSDYPADAWTAAYIYTNASNNQTITGTPNGTAFDFSLTSADSATWAAGDYKWIAFVTSAGERSQVAAGATTVYPDPAAGPTDLRSQLEKLRDDLMAAYAELTQAGAMEVSVSMESGASVSFRDRGELWVEIQRVNAAIGQEKVAAGLQVPGAVRVRFTG